MQSKSKNAKEDALQKLSKTCLRKAFRLLGTNSSHKDVPVSSDLLTSFDSLSFDHTDFGSIRIQVPRRNLRQSTRTATCFGEVLPNIAKSTSQPPKSKSLLSRQVRILQKAVSAYCAKNRQSYEHEMKKKEMDNRPLNHFLSSFDFDPLRVSLVYSLPLPYEASSRNSSDSHSRSEIESGRQILMHSAERTLEYSRPCGYVVAMKYGESLALCGATRIALCTPLDLNEESPCDAAAANAGGGYLEVNGLRLSLQKRDRHKQQQHNEPNESVETKSRELNEVSIRHIVPAVSITMGETLQDSHFRPRAHVQTFGVGNLIEVHAPSWSNGTLFSLDACANGDSSFDDEDGVKAILKRGSTDFLYVLLLPSGISNDPSPPSPANGFGLRFLSSHRLPRVQVFPDEQLETLSDKSVSNGQEGRMLTNMDASVLLDSCLQEIYSRYAQLCSGGDGRSGGSDGNDMSDGEQKEASLARNSEGRVTAVSIGTVLEAPSMLSKVISSSLPTVLVALQHCIVKSFGLCTPAYHLPNTLKHASFDVLPFSDPDVLNISEAQSNNIQNDVRSETTEFSGPFPPPYPEHVLMSLSRLEVDDLLRGTRTVFSTALSVYSNSCTHGNFKSVMGDVFSACIAALPPFVAYAVITSPQWQSIWSEHYCISREHEQEKEGDTFSTDEIFEGNGCDETEIKSERTSHDQAVANTTSLIEESTMESAISQSAMSQQSVVAPLEVAESSEWDEFASRILDTPIPILTSPMDLVPNKSQDQNSNPSVNMLSSAMGSQEEVDYVDQSQKITSQSSFELPVLVGAQSTDSLVEPSETLTSPPESQAPSPLPSPSAEKENAKASSSHFIDHALTHYFVFELLIARCLSTKRSAQIGCYSNSALVFPGLPGASFMLCSSQIVSDSASNDYKTTYWGNYQSASSYAKHTSRHDIIMLPRTDMQSESKIETQSNVSSSASMTVSDQTPGLNFIGRWQHLLPKRELTGALAQFLCCRLFRFGNQYQRRDGNMSAMFEGETVCHTGFLESFIHTHAVASNLTTAIKEGGSWRQDEIRRSTTLSPLHSNISLDIFKGNTISVGPRWQAALNLICSASSKSSVLPPVIMLIGERNSGKSTFARMAVNRLCSWDSYGSSGFLDVDPGQTESSPSCALTLSLISSDIDCVLDRIYSHYSTSTANESTFKAAPFTGPPCTRVNSVSNWPFEGTQFTGLNTPSTDPEVYMSAVTRLISKWYTVVKDTDGEPIWAKCPLVINTPGWTRSLGKTVLNTILAIARPSVVIEINDDLVFPHDPRDIFCPTLENAHIHADHAAQARTSGSYPPKQARAKLCASTFLEHAVFASRDPSTHIGQLFGSDILLNHTGWLMSDVFTSKRAGEPRSDQRRNGYLCDSLGLKVTKELRLMDFIRGGRSYREPIPLRKGHTLLGDERYVTMMHRSLYDTSVDLLGCYWSFSYHPIVLLLPTYVGDTGPCGYGPEAAERAIQTFEEFESKRLQQEQRQHQQDQMASVVDMKEETTSRALQQLKTPSSTSDALVGVDTIIAANDAFALKQQQQNTAVVDLKGQLLPHEQEYFCSNIPFGNGIRFIPYDPRIKRLGVGQSQHLEPFSLSLMRLISRTWQVQITNDIKIEQHQHYPSANLENSRHILSMVRNNINLAAAVHRELSLLGYLSSQMSYNSNWDPLLMRRAFDALSSSSSKWCRSATHQQQGAVDDKQQHGGYNVGSAGPKPLSIPFIVDRTNLLSFAVCEPSFVTKYVLGAVNGVKLVTTDSLFEQVSKRVRYTNLTFAHPNQRRPPRSVHAIGEPLQFRNAKFLKGMIVALAIDTAHCVMDIDARFAALGEDGFGSNTAHLDSRETRKKSKVFDSVVRDWCKQQNAVASPFVVGMALVRGIDVVPNYMRERAILVSDPNVVRESDHFVLEIMTPTPPQIVQKVNLIITSFPSTARPPNWLEIDPPALSGGVPQRHITALSGRESRGTGSAAQKSRHNIQR